MKQPLTKREIVIAAVSLALLIGAGFYISNLRQTQVANERLIASQNTMLKAKETNTNKTDNYIEAICAEYRKLYQSYREVRYPNSENVDKYIGLPGSAKGQIDECYLPD